MRRSQNFSFLSLKKFISRSVFGELQLTQISINVKTSCSNLKIRGLEAKCVWLFYYFNFERNYDVLKSKSRCILLNKNINFNKNETESKMENLTESCRETKLVVQFIQESQIRVKLWWVGARERKKRAFFVPLILSGGNFFNISDLAQYTLIYIE